MKKLFTTLTLFLSLILITSAFPMTLVWDTYTDSESQLRIYHSIDQTNWTILVNDIPYTYEASEISDGSDDTRVYYMMRAFDSQERESGNSNIVSFYWTSGGGGHIGPAAIGNIRLLDCSSYDAIPDDSSIEWSLCNGRFNK